ncbi:hypothetical protein BD770DRAFT_449895, partial [Pilaira anomala]
MNPFNNNQSTSATGFSSSLVPTMSGSTLENGQASQRLSSSHQVSFGFNSPAAKDLVKSTKEHLKLLEEQYMVTLRSYLDIRKCSSSNSVEFKNALDVNKAAISEYLDVRYALDMFEAAQLPVKIYRSKENYLVYNRKNKFDLSGFSNDTSLYNGSQGNNKRDFGQRSSHKKPCVHCNKTWFQGHRCVEFRVANSRKKQLVSRMAFTSCSGKSASVIEKDSYMDDDESYENGLARLTLELAIMASGSSEDTITPARLNVSRSGSDAAFAFAHEGEDEAFNPLNDISSVASGRTADDRDEHYLLLRQQQQAMIDYVHMSRPAKVEEAYALFGRITEVEKSLDMVNPESRQALMILIQQQKNEGLKIESMLAQFDKRLESGRNYLEEELTALMERQPVEFRQRIRRHNWPTMMDCQTLRLNQDLVNFITNPNVDDVPGGSTNESATIAELRQLVLSLQNELRKVKLNEDTGRTSTSLVISSDKKQESAFLGEELLSKQEIRERRKRVQVPSFAQGSPRKARDWLIEYKNVCHHIRFSEKERLDDLQIRFKGQALSWYTYLPSVTKRDWQALEKAFLDYFGGGESIVESALKELKELKQGKMRMVQFGQVLREVARKAEIFPERMLISYLKAAVNPEMTRAIIYRGPTTYNAAVNICIEVETDLLAMQMDTTTKSLTTVYFQGGESSNYEEKQNYQMDRKKGFKRDNGYKSKTWGSGNEKRDEKKACFRCKKQGHLKKDCKVKLQGNYQQNSQVVETSTSGNANDQDYSDYGEDDEENEMDIFGHFFSNNQDLVENNDMKLLGGNR